MLVTSHGNSIRTYKSQNLILNLLSRLVLRHKGRLKRIVLLFVSLFRLTFCFLFRVFRLLILCFCAFSSALFFLTLIECTLLLCFVFLFCFILQRFLRLLHLFFRISGIPALFYLIFSVLFVFLWILNLFWCFYFLWCSVFDWLLVLLWFRLFRWH